MNIRSMVYISMCAAIVAVLGLLPPITLPLTPVPITAQTLGVMLAGALLGAKRGSLSLIIFVLLVTFGAPLLSGGRGGIGVFFGPSGGYILSWPIAAFVIGWLVEKFWNRMNVGLFLLFNFIGGILVVYSIGITYLSMMTGTPWLAAATAALVTYVPGDLVKVVVAALLADQMRRVYPLIGKDKERLSRVA
ncbi:biotin transporter BioY [Bacillus tianshenii]|nr:biotin transporter BioY [Bacillus tianshenii]